jgi:hypothetical protein
MAREQAKPVVFQHPEIPAKFRIGVRQGVGVLLLFLVVIASLLDWVGEKQGEEHIDAGSWSLQLEWPKATNFGAPSIIHLELTNRGEVPLRNVELQFDPRYTKGFSDLRFQPRAEAGLVVRLGEISPGATVPARLELRGERAGRHEGKLGVKVGEGRREVGISTFVFP